MNLRISPDGGITCVYGEAIDLARLGRLTIHRASHVEPTGDSQWFADLSPVGGPVLSPYPTRSAALAAEADWLDRHFLGVAPWC